MIFMRRKEGIGKKKALTIRPPFYCTDRNSAENDTDVLRISISWESSKGRDSPKQEIDRPRQGLGLGKQELSLYDDKSIFGLSSR